MKKGIDYVGIFVTGICHDGMGNILYRRRGPGAQDERGKWDPGVGGALNHGETIEECLKREMREEIGTEPIEFTFLGHMEKFRELTGTKTHWLGFYYKCLVDPLKVVKDSKGECDEMVWASFHAPQVPMMLGHDDTYEKFKNLF
jgi:8-oxo-dGTP pyrophosphatase MutT (NUDIX family)